MNCGMTPIVPLVATEPVCIGSSPAIRRSSVDLPAPFAPTNATTPPAGTRKDTSSSSGVPSGSA
jgi:hypothetical protein